MWQRPHLLTRMGTTCLVKLTLPVNGLGCPAPAGAEFRQADAFGRQLPLRLGDVFAQRRGERLQLFGVVFGFQFGEQLLCFADGLSRFLKFFGLELPSRFFQQRIGGSRFGALLRAGCRSQALPADDQQRRTRHAATGEKTAAPPVGRARQSGRQAIAHACTSSRSESGLAVVETGCPQAGRE